MDHTEAARKAAVEKYLLGELTQPERDSFEEHFFECPDCAAQVRLAAAFRANARAVLRDSGGLHKLVPERRTGWNWSVWSWQPRLAMAAGLALAVVVGYQNLVTIPHLRHDSSGGADFAVVAAAQASGVRAASDLSFSRKAGQFSLFVPHEWEEAYSSYTCELERRPGSTVVFSAGTGTGSGDFTVLVRTASLAPGKYVLNVYGERAGGQKTAVARFPLTLTE